jgi:hypothetical protein
LDAVIEELLCQAATQSNDTDEIREISKMYVEMGYGSWLGCDGCDEKWSREITDCTDLPGDQVAYDRNGDVDVTICPFCVRDAQNHYAEGE